jgi:hypothetical protein
VLNSQYNERADHLADALPQPVAPGAVGRSEPHELPCGEQIRAVNAAIIRGAAGYGTPATAEITAEVSCSAHS